MLVTTSQAQVRFIYGTKVESSAHFEPGFINLDTLESLGINDLWVYATLNHTDWPIQIQRLDQLGITVRASNHPDFDSPGERGWIQSALNRAARKSHARYCLWQAEDDHVTEGPMRYGLSYRTGSATESGWRLDADDRADTVNTGPHVVMEGGSPADPTRFLVQYRLRFSGLDPTDSLRPVVSLHGLHGNPSVCFSVRNPVYDTLLLVRDFLDSSGRLGNWKVFDYRFQYVRNWPPPFRCHPQPNDSLNHDLEFRMYWYGEGVLELDWVRCMDLPNGYNLVQNPDESLYRLPIKQLAARFASWPVTGWFANESGWQYPGSFGAYQFVDSLVRDTVRRAGGGPVYVFEDVSLVPIGRTPGDLARWDEYMYRMLKYDSLRVLDVWSIDFDAAAERRGYDNDSVNLHWYNPISSTMNRHIMPWLDSVPHSQVLGEIQVWCGEPHPDSNLFPRANDVSCQAFLYLACGAKGLVYNRFDGWTCSNDRGAWGLTYYYPAESGHQVYSQRYRAARNWVTPLVIEPDSVTEPWGRLLARLDWRGSGLADTLAGTPASLLSGFQSTARPAWVEAGFFVDSIARHDYLMLVNRRTLDSSSQSFRFRLDASRLAVPNQPWYWVIDLNPQDTLRGEDTLLVDAVSGRLALSAKIRPGGVKFLRIEAASGIPAPVALLPDRYALSQNVPNPFNASTRFDLSLPEASDYAVRIYNIAGQRVRTFAGHLEAGVHQLTWDGRNERGDFVASGLYFYNAEAGDFSLTRKMMLLK